MSCCRVSSSRSVPQLLQVFNWFITLSRSLEHSCFCDVLTPCEPDRTLKVAGPPAVEAPAVKQTHVYLLAFSITDGICNCWNLVYVLDFILYYLWVLYSKNKHMNKVILIIFCHFNTKIPEKDPVWVNEDWDDTPCSDPGSNWNVGVTCSHVLKKNRTDLRSVIRDGSELHAELNWTSGGMWASVNDSLPAGVDHWPLTPRQTAQSHEGFSQQNLSAGFMFVHFDLIQRHWRWKEKSK